MRTDNIYNKCGINLASMQTDSSRAIEQEAHARANLQYTHEHARTDFHVINNNNNNNNNNNFI